MTKGLRWDNEQLALYRQRRRADQAPEKEIKPKPRGRRPVVQTKKPQIVVLLQQLALAGAPEPTLEYRFAAPERQWRSDLAWPEHKVLGEYEGGIWTGGAHTRGKHYQSDCEKYNAAALRGFAVYRFTYDMVKSGLAVSTLLSALEIEWRIR